MTTGSVNFSLLMRLAGHFGLEVVGLKTVNQVHHVVQRPALALLKQEEIATLLGKRVRRLTASFRGERSFRRTDLKRLIRTLETPLGQAALAVFTASSTNLDAKEALLSGAIALYDFVEGEWDFEREMPPPLQEHTIEELLSLPPRTQLVTRRIDGHRTFIIGESHHPDPSYIMLEKSLVQRAAEEEIILLVESLPRDEVWERKWYKNKHSGATPSGLIFGLEVEWVALFDLLLLTHIIGRFLHGLLIEQTLNRPRGMNSIYESDLEAWQRYTGDFFGFLYISETLRTYWRDLPNVARFDAFAREYEQVNDLLEIKPQAQALAVFKHLIRSDPFLGSPFPEGWNLMTYSLAALMAEKEGGDYGVTGQRLELFHTLSKEGNPGHPFTDYLCVFSCEWRTPFWAENIQQIAREHPPEIDMWMIVGMGHLPILKGLVPLTNSK